MEPSRSVPERVLDERDTAGRRFLLERADGKAAIVAA
jgi:hypothetical protein